MSSPYVWPEHPLRGYTQIAAMLKLPPLDCARELLAYGMQRRVAQIAPAFRVSPL